MAISFFRIKPTFWTGRTGRRINSLSNCDTVRILAAYLFSSPEANPFGLYQLPLNVASIHTRKSAEQLLEAFVCLQELEFSQYDEETEFVWVYGMAEEQMELPLKPHDFRCRWASSWWRHMEENPFIGAFFERYKEFLHLPERKPLGRGLEGACKGQSALALASALESASVSAPLNLKSESASEKGGQGENKTPAQLLNESWRLVVDAAEKWFSQKTWAHLATTRLVKIDDKQRYVIWCPSTDHKKMVNDNAAKLREIAHGLGFKVNRFIFQEARQRVEVKK